MSGLDQIPITVAGMENRAMVNSILLEIATLLEAYLQTGERRELDLQSLPLTAVDQQVLQRVLGEGEIKIGLNVMGESEIIETRFAGVWRITHRDQEGRVTAEIVEIAAVPAIIEADPAEMRGAIDTIKMAASE